MHTPEKACAISVATYKSFICNCQRTENRFNVQSSTLEPDGFNIERKTSNVEPENGGGERDRTDDPLRARQVLSQLSYTPGKPVTAVQRSAFDVNVEP